MFAAPHKGDIFRLKQPDGSYVAVKVWGDEFYQRVESLDGYTLVRNSKTGWICYAELSKGKSDFVATDVVYRGRAAANTSLLKSGGIGWRFQKGLRLDKESVRRKAAMAREALRVRIEEPPAPAVPVPPAKSLSAHAAATSSKSIVGLTLLIDFPNVPADVNRVDIDNFLNQRGYDGNGNNGSVRDYFYDVSNGQVDYTNHTIEYYTAKKNKSYYTNPKARHGSRAEKLIREALNALEERGFDFSVLTTNTYGRVLGVNALYAGEVDNGWSKGLWPHCGWFRKKFRADGVYAQRYQITNIGTMDPNTDSPLQLRTFCHENGHMLFFWPDLYDYGWQSGGAGDYCLMAWGGSDTNPVPPNPYFAGAQGWVNTYQMNHDSISSEYFHEANSFAAHRFSNLQNLNEYFLIESRLKTGRNASLPDEGLLIWHIDRYGRNNYEQMKPSRHYQVSVEQADGMFDLENRFSGGDPNDLFHADGNDSFGGHTQPNSRWWSGRESGLAVTNISAVGSTMSFSALKTMVTRKCQVKAGKSRKREPVRGLEGFVGRDRISLLGLISAAGGDLAGAAEIHIAITSVSDGHVVFDESLTIDHTRLKKGKYRHRDKQAGISFKLDTKTKKGTYSLQARNADLTGLACPFRVEIEVGDYYGMSLVDEPVVNGKKPIPIRLVSGHAATPLSATALQEIRAKGSWKYQNGR